MSSIQPFTLFEDGKTKIYFRSPTVEDYRYFAGAAAWLEELTTTEFLDRLQDKERYRDGQIKPSIDWTGEDRRTALFYIFISTRTDTVIGQEYTCKHCGKPHRRKLDLLDLGVNFFDAQRSMIDKVQFNKGDEVIDGYIVPLRGHAVEHLEELRNARDDHEEDSREWNIAHVDLRLYEVAYGLKLKGEDKALTERERADSRFKMLLQIDPEKEFKKLRAKVQLTWAEMRHGLYSEYMEGEIKIRTTEHICPNHNGQEGGDIKSTLLLMPFHYKYFLPDFR